MSKTATVLLVAVSPSLLCAESAVRLWNSSVESATEGAVELHATPAEVYRLSTDFAHWGALFTDAESVEVKSGTARDAVVRFHSKVLKETVTVQFDNQDPKAVRFRMIDGPPGASASGEFYTIPLPDGQTRVQARFFLQVKGIASLFVGSAKVKKMREDKLSRDLGDLFQRFH